MIGGIDQIGRGSIEGGRGVRKPRYLPTAEREARDAAIVRRFHAGESLARLGRAFGLTESGVSRVLLRLGARLSPAETRARFAAGARQARATGPKPVWPDCPPHLRADYQRIRVVIGSRAARDQLLELDSRRRGNDERGLAR
jgi:hypothetical protein